MASDTRIFITGMGVVSAIGAGKAQTWESISGMKTGIGPVRYLKTGLTGKPVGEVKLSNEEMASRLGLSDGTPVSRTSLMGILALKEALEQAGLSARDIQSAALISGTTVGGMDQTERYFSDFLSEGSAHSEFIPLHDCGASTDAIADYFGGFSLTTTLSTACSSAANSAMFGADLIKSGKTSIAAVGGSECLSDFHMNGFNSLMILDDVNCRPFDAGRAGLNLGEGAAFLILESEESMKARGASPLGELIGYGNACDAFHQTASSENGEGAFLAMEKALAMAGLQPESIDYINAHGTGTVNNDMSESAAIKRVFGENIPPVSSTKGMTGHTTSASGSIESVICLLAMEHGFIPASYGWETLAEGCIVPFTGDGSGHPLSKVMCNSFGFGGNDSSLVFSK